MRWVVRGFIVLGLLVTLSACGTGRSSTTGAPLVPVEQVTPSGRYGGNVTAVESQNARTLRLTLTPIDPGQDCVRDAKADLIEQTPDAVYITSTVRVSTPDCPPQALVATAVLDADLAGRQLVVDQRTWVLEPAGATSGQLRQCDTTVGCNPKPAGCDDDSYRLAVDAGDFPRNGRSWTPRACTAPWLILDVDITASGCAATGDDPTVNPCSSGARRVTRWVFMQRGPLWDTTGTLPASGGCGPRPPAGLPLALCERLPSV